MQESKSRSAAVLLAMALVPAKALASAPAGVWVKVQEVVYAPDATNPTHVQVHGALMLYDGNLEAPRPYPGYTSPELGYMYYRCPDGQAEICRQEWHDLEANIAKPDTECLGFGMTSLPTGTLRRPGEAPEGPDAYPIQSGVSPGFSPCQAIANYLANEAATGGAGGVGGAASAGGTDANPGGAPVSSGGASSTGKPEAGDSSGAAPVGSGKGGTTAGRASDLDPREPTEAATADSEVSGCSIAEATGAASLFGFGAALGIFALALARRNRHRK
jgi:hypothetical protein